MIGVIPIFQSAAAGVAVQLYTTNAQISATWTNPGLGRVMPRFRNHFFQQFWLRRRERAPAIVKHKSAVMKE